MPFRSNRRQMQLRPVDSVKHIVETNGAVSAGLASTTDVITSPATSTLDLKATTNAVFRGSTVNAIYLRVEVVGAFTAGGVDNIYMAVVKNPGNNLTFPALDSLGTSDVRKFVIHQEMIMLSPPGTDNLRFPRTMFNGVIVIPRGYRRNGVSDKLQVILQHRPGEMTQLTEFCIECIYKEFR